MEEKDFFAAMKKGIPPIKAPDPLQDLEANEGICAQEDDQ